MNFRQYKITIAVLALAVPAAGQNVLHVTNDDTPHDPWAGDKTVSDGDGTVGMTDLVALLASRGPCASYRADLDSDGTVSVSDLLTLPAACGSELTARRDLLSLPPHLPSWFGDSRAVDLADFDGDGDLDAFIGSAPGNYASILRNDGHGRFSMTDWISGPYVASVPTDVVVVDLDQDGDLDLSVARAYDSGGSPTDIENSTYLNDGDGRMTGADYLMPYEGISFSIDAGDIDGDSYPDVYVSDMFADQFFRNTFPEPFEELPPLIDEASGSNGEAMEDFDGDGDVDIFVSSGGQGHLFINDGAGSFSDASADLPTVDDWLYNFVTGDVDGDGDIDMVVRPGGGDPLCLWINNGDSGFTDVPGAFSVLGGSVLELFDADGDSDLDLFFVNGAGVVLFLNDGAGNFSEGGQVPPEPAQWVSDVASGDVDGDGDLDLLLGVFGHDRLWINNGSGSFVQAGAVLFVDDDAPGDPGPRDPLVSDPLEDGSLDHPFDAIQEAIDVAMDTDEIVVAPGTYFETIDLLGKAVWLHSSDGPSVTTIDGTGHVHVVQCISGEGADTVLDGFTITGGNANGPCYPLCGVDTRGGGMLNVASSPTVNNCTFSENSALWGGGGMSNWESSPTVTDCTFSGNSANSGGGMYNENSSPTVTNCTFSGNTAVGYAGGMANWDGSSPTVTDCIFEGNTASDKGGGMYNVGSSSPTVTNCVFSGNMAFDDDSCGGMYNDDDSNPNVTNCTFSGNSGFVGGGIVNQHSSPTVNNCTFTGNSGGGMVNSAIGMGYNPFNSSPTVTNCTFSGNSGWVGGGMNNLAGSPTVTNCTFSGNTATYGGGMYNWESSPTVTDCTFTGNTANASGGGGGIHSHSSSLTVTNCTFSGNSAPNGSALAFESSNQNPSDLVMTNGILWDGGDEIWNNDGSTLTITYSNVEGGWPGVGNIDADPLFVDPDNGDFRLSAGSPCIDAGHNNAIVNLAEADLDGNPRFADDPATADTGCGVPVVVDMGAYEYQGNPADVTFADLNGDNIVGSDDFETLLGCWSSSDEPCCMADLDLDGAVGVVDFLILLANWD
jgi:parallel beta-helix repeat protein